MPGKPRRRAKRVCLALVGLALLTALPGIVRADSIRDVDPWSLDDQATVTQVADEIALPESDSGEFDPAAVRVAGLKDQLEKGLKARRQVEFVFIDQIVVLVETNRLPLKMVLETFQWARQKDSHFPFPYFERAIRVRAARIGVAIP